MLSPKPSERRRSLRHNIGHLVQMQIEDDAAPHECVLLNISDEGVRIFTAGFTVPDVFDLLFPDGEPERYAVIWRRDREIGARFLGRTPPAQKKLNVRAIFELLDPRRP